MTKLTFAKGIEYLNAYYVNFKVDLDNKLVQQVWYDALKHIDDVSFDILISNYAKDNIFPPQSPTHLLDKYKALFDEYVKYVVLEVKRLENDNMVLNSDKNHYYIDYKKAEQDAIDPIIKDVLHKIRIRVLKDGSPKSIESYLSNPKWANMSLQPKLKDYKEGKMISGVRNDE